MNNENPLINIIVPIYNVEAYLRKCIDSILAQTYTNIRIILVDDGSPDGCPAICDEYASCDSRVRTVHRLNGGLSAARNSGLSLLRNGELSAIAGDYVAFIDSDDYIAPDYIAFLYQLLVENNADVSQCGHYIVYSNKRMVDKNPNHNTVILNKIEALESVCYNGIYDVTSCSKLYKLSLFNSIRFPEGRIYEDTAVAHLIADKINKAVCNMTPKYYYIQRYNSTANGTKFSEKKYQFLQAGDEMAEYISTKYPQLTQVANIKRVFVRLSTLSQMVNSNHYDWVRIQEMKHVIKQYRKDVLHHPKASIRDKLGMIVLMFGYPFYRFVWKLYYKQVRKK